MPRSDPARDAEHTEVEVPDEQDEVETPAVNARTVSEERTVLTEDGNPDGWISTDLTVESRL